MAKVLSNISFDLPASPLSAAVNDTFSFAGTPSFAGGGGVQRYDYKWEVDSGGGFVTIGASSGLTSAGTNPVSNTNSQAQQTLSVTCSDAGSYTLRMVGAPTSGGSYTVLSSTQTVEVALAGIVGTMAAVETGSDTFAASGAVAVSGSMAASESGADSFAASGGVAIAGTLTVAETGSDTFAATGAVTEPGVTGTMAVQETGPDTFAGAGEVAIAGMFAVVESGSDIATMSGTVAISGAMTVQESANDNFSGAGAVAITGTMAGIETGSDTFSATSGQSVGYPHSLYHRCRISIGF